MRRITLVFTVHSEKGLCNEAELLKILEELDPEVVFEEVRPEDHEWLYRNESKHSLEMQAISRYRKIKPILQVPVDGFSIPIGFKAGVDELFDFVESNSKRYCEAFSSVNQMAHHRGFKYLNSLEHIEMRNGVDESFEEAIAKSGNVRLKKLLSNWYGQLRQREHSMLEGIYAFSRQHSFSRGVFLVGSAHMSYFVKSIENRVSEELGLIEWRIWSEH